MVTRIYASHDDVELSISTDDDGDWAKIKYDLSFTSLLTDL